MTEIACKISDLEEICKLASLKGKDPRGKEYCAIPDFLIACDKDTVEIRAVDSKKAIGLSLSYKVQVKVAGAIPIGDVTVFKGYLDRFNSSDEVTVSTTENQIIITRLSPQKIARIPMDAVETLTTFNGAEQTIQNFQFNEKGFPESKKTKLNLRLVVNADEIKNVIDDGEAVKQRIYPWNLADGSLSIKVGDEKFGQIESWINLIEIESEIPNQPQTKTSFAFGLDNIFNNISGEIKIYLANGVENCPIYVQKETEKYYLAIILAPAVKEE